eukprot:418318-Pleurochrysis_carterae.AAC.1
MPAASLKDVRRTRWLAIVAPIYPFEATFASIRQPQSRVRRRESLPLDRKLRAAELPQACCGGLPICDLRNAAQAH